MNNGIAGVGAALVDLLIQESDNFVASLGSPKGGMTLVDLEKIDGILKNSHAQICRVPGGSACNTLVGIGQLGGQAGFVGKCGRDETASFFKKGIETAGVKGILGESGTETGRVLSIITPDAQRTMFTYLGASAELSPQDIRAEDFEDTGIIYLEGYLLFNRPVVEAIVQMSGELKKTLCIDLGSFQVVEFAREFLGELLSSHVNMVIANEDEARAFTGKGEKESLEIFARNAEIAVVKRGSKGALIARGDERVEVPAGAVKVVDTTGAGDLWASGFLFGLMNGYSLFDAGRLGAFVASEVIQVIGAVIPEEGWKRIHAFRGAIELGG